MPHIQVDELGMYYATQGSGPVVVLLHALGSCADDWLLQVPALAGSYTVLAPDLRGHGRTGKPSGLYSIRQMADDVAGMIERLATGPAHVMGLSLGGLVAQALAIDHPDRVRSLVLINTFARLRTRGSTGWGLLLRRGWTLLTRGLEAQAEIVAAALFPHAEQSALRQMVVQRLKANDPRAYRAAIWAALCFDSRRDLARIRVPTLVVAGVEDTTVSMAAKEALAAGIPGARLERVAHSGHATVIDQAEVLNHHIAAFLRAVAGQERRSGMENLVALKCVACRGDEPPLAREEIDELLPMVPQWKLVEREGVERLERSFRFADFAEALAFTVKVGELAEAEGHHPALLTRWASVAVSWWTHKIRGLHKNDFIMAAKTDALFGSGQGS